MGLPHPVTAKSSRRIAPGPIGVPLLGNLLAFRRDVLELALAASRQFGDIVRFKLGPRVVHLVNHPDHINHVLQTHQDNYERGARSAKKIALVCGEGLLTTSGDVWSRQRRLVQPAFHPQCAAGFLPVMIDAASAMVERWRRHAADDRPIAVDAEMSRLTYAIVATSMFGGSVIGDAQAVADAMGVLLDQTYRRIEHLADLPLWVPTFKNRRFIAARATLDRIVYRLIQDRRGSPGQTADLLTLLLHATDDNGGDPMSDRQLRDQTITLLLSGHQTTADALSWMFYLIGTHPEVEDRLRHELAGVLSGRPPSADDLARLPYAATVLSESMRLYPPIWILERRVIKDDEIGGYHIPAGSTIVVSPFTLHRHPAYWRDPDAFLPERFNELVATGRLPPAYMPFGAGPHYCIGSHLATLEARVVLAMVVQALSLRLPPGFRVKPKGGITLRFGDGLMMTAQSVDAST